jgi:hypothetical protein
MATYDSDDEIRRSPLLEPQNIVYGPSVSPPPFLPESPPPSPLESQKGGRRQRNPGPRASQGDRVLINNLAPNHPDIAQIAGDFPLSPEPDPEDEEDGEATHHNAELASTEPTEQESFTLVNPAKILGRKESKERTGGGNALQQNGLAVLYTNRQEIHNCNSGRAAPILVKDIHPAGLLTILPKDSSTPRPETPHLDGTSTSQGSPVQSTYTPSVTSNHTLPSEDKENADPTPGEHWIHVDADGPWTETVTHPTVNLPLGVDSNVRNLGAVHLHIQQSIF